MSTTATTTAAGVSGPAPKAARGLNIGLWIAQALLALAFGMAGMMKLLTPIEELAKNADWVLAHPGLMRFIGISEVAGALGILLPALTRMKPALTRLAAVGLLMIMVLASAFHISRGEFNHLPATVILGALAAFVAWGRYRKAPIAPRGQSR